MYAALMVAGLSAAAAALPPLPNVYPVATGYPSVDPLGSATWFVDYFGGELVDANITIPEGCAAEVAWVRLPGSGYEFHFVFDPAAATGEYSFSDFEAYVRTLHGDLNEVTADHGYDQFMDYHVGMITDNMTPFYAALTEYAQPLFMVGQYPSFFDLFVQIPYTGAILEITSQRLDIPDVPITAWDICQSHDGAQALRALSDSAGARGGEVGLAGYPVLDWRKTTVASPHSAEALAFSVAALGARFTQQAHAGVNIKGCAKIHWSNFPQYRGPANISYALHFVNGFSYPPHSGLNLSTFVDNVRDTRDFKADKWDGWADSHLTFWADDLQPFADRWEQLGLDYLVRSSDASGADMSLLVSDPLNAWVYEVAGPPTAIKGRTAGSKVDDHCGAATSGIDA